MKKKWKTKPLSLSLSSRPTRAREVLLWDRTQQPRPSDHDSTSDGRGESLRSCFICMFTIKLAVRHPMNGNICLDEFKLWSVCLEHCISLSKKNRSFILYIYILIRKLMWVRIYKLRKSGSNIFNKKKNLFFFLIKAEFMRHSPSQKLKAGRRHACLAMGWNFLFLI